MFERFFSWIISHFEKFIKNHFDIFVRVEWCLVNEVLGRIKSFFFMRCNCCKPLLFLVSYMIFQCVAVRTVASNSMKCVLAPGDGKNDAQFVSREVDDPCRNSPENLWYEKIVLNSHLMFTRFFPRQTKKSEETKITTVFRLPKVGLASNRISCSIVVGTGAISGGCGTLVKGRGCSWATLSPKDSVWEDWGTLEKIRGNHHLPLKNPIY